VTFCYISLISSLLILKLGNITNVLCKYQRYIHIYFLPCFSFQNICTLGLFITKKKQEIIVKLFSYQGVHLCHDPSFGLVTKAKARTVVSREYNPGVTFALLQMWGNELTHSQVGSWNPYGIPNFQKGISEVKTH